MKNTKVTVDSDRFEAIEAYTIKKYELDKPLRPETEEGMAALDNAKALFAQGEFSDAAKAFEAAVPLLVLKKNKIEAYLNLALCHQVENDVPAMKTAFREILELDDDYELDAESFPQKTQIIFFQVKSSMDNE